MSLTKINFSQTLLKWYTKNARDLPWRRTRDPYKIWISEVMLQQTTVKAVIPYYKKWLKKFPTVSSVACAPLQKVLKSWQGLGYYQRAKNIHKAAKLIVRDAQGKIPQDPHVLRKLPGFGPYTTGAVLSIAFGKREPIIDANVRRVFMRILNLKGHADISQDQVILKFLEKIMPTREMSNFNQALMELGALVCRNKEPVCSLCPVRKGCAAYKKGRQELIPKPRKQTIQNIEASVAIIERDQKYFIQKRSSSGLLADLWEFPGGKVKRGESPRQALIRELKEELDVHVASARPLMHVQHFYTQFRVLLHVWQCTPRKYPQQNARRKWVAKREFTRYPMPSGSAKILDRLTK